MRTRPAAGLERRYRQIDGDMMGPPAADTAPRVLAVDRRPLMASGLAGLAGRALGCSADGVVDIDQAVAALRPESAKPRTVLLGVRSGDDAEQLVRAARRLGAPVICVLAGGDAALARTALGAEADGYVLLEEAGTETLRATVAAVEAGERVIPTALARFVGGGVRGSGAITDRCLEVVRSLAEGLHDDEIAERLQISTSSVRKHIRTAQERLEAQTRTQVVAMVAKSGLL